MANLFGRGSSVRGSRTLSLFCRSPLARSLRYESLEDRRLLAVLTVDTDQDVIDFNDGVTSLREAIFAANTVPGSDEIIFDFGHDGPATILLTRGELKIEDSLTITGPGAELLTIDASGIISDGSSSVFNISDGKRATAIDTSLQGLTLTGAQNSAIRNRENLTLLSMILSDNKSMAGGAIWMEPPSDSSVLSLNLIDSTLVNNMSFDGGAIYFGGYSDQLTIRDTVISNNKVDHGRGGGVCIVGLRNHIEIIDTRFENNSASRGGGLYVSNAGTDVRIIRSDISRNTASSQGGGINAQVGYLQIERSTITVNVAGNDALSGDGGGLWFSGGGEAVIYESTISGNLATTMGGGIAAGGGILSVNQSTFSGNWSKFGGAISSTNLILHNSTVSGNSAQSSGGGISSSGYVKIINSTVTSNSAQYGGGISRPHTLLLEGSLVAKNNAASTPDVAANFPAVAGGFVSRHSLIGTSAGTNLTEAPIGSPDAKGNLIGGPIHGVIDPLLGPLAENGGPTKTHALLPGSPAIDAGDPTLVAGENGVPEFDQRGEPFTRVFGGRIDIGAFEAQSLIVDTLVDEINREYSAGNFSLREAIELANLIPGANTIEFDPSLVGGTISLSIGHLNITDSVEIVGLGRDLLTIENSQTQGPIFNVNDQIVTNLITVRIEGLTLSGSKLSAIRSSEDLTVEGLLIRDNTAPIGGGINVSQVNGPNPGAKLTVLDSVFINNRAIGNDIGSGGGIAFSANTGQLTIANSTFNNNQAASRGGAVNAMGFRNVVHIVDSTFNANSARQGGGLAISDDNQNLATLERLIVKDNTAMIAGGGIYLTGKPVVIVDCQITGNNTGVGSSPIQGGGGGIYKSGGDSFTVRTTTISNNHSDGDGGGIALRGSSIVMNDLIIENNTATRGGGGILAVSSGRLEFDRTTIADNLAGLRGGGIDMQSRNANMFVRNSTISGNETQGSGGGLYLLGNTVSLVNATVSGNRADKSGGGIYLSRTTGALKTAIATITGNISDAEQDGVGTGGGIFAHFATQLHLNSSIIAGNIDNSGLADDVNIEPFQSYSLIGEGAEFLGPLADNGGPTKTHALLPGSPAIDAGDPTLIPNPGGTLEFDQRGEPFTRLFGGRIDIGAFEAQSLIVDTLIDENDGDYSEGDFSLREAIALANQIAGANTIEFDPSLAGGTILLTHGELKITDSVEIVGLGAEMLTIDAQQQSRIFDISAAADTTLIGMSLTGGRTTGVGSLNAGGAIRSEALLTIERSKISGNSTEGSNASGGGIYAKIQLTLNECAIVSNHTLGNSSRGGGVFSGGLVATDCDISGNKTYGSNSPGGGISTSGNRIGPVALSSSRISNNSTFGDGSAGAGISVNGLVTIDDSVLSDNFTFGANSGGAAVDFSTSPHTLVISSTDLSNNSTFGSNSAGGAILAQGTVVITESTLSGNKTRLSGGGALNWSSGPKLTVADSKLINNSAYGDSFGGGAIWARGRAAITGSQISGNKSVAGGGGIDAEDSLTVIRSEISNNQTVGYQSTGGGIRFDRGQVSIEQSMLQGNQAIGRFGKGGGLFVSGIAAIKSSTVSGNSVIGANVSGGGVYSLNSLSIKNSTLSGNEVNGIGSRGGGVYSRSTLTIEHSTITNNRALNSDSQAGGVKAGGQSTIRHSIIAGNSATGSSPDLSLALLQDLRSSIIGTKVGTNLTEAPLGSPDANGNFIGGPINGVLDPLLGPLADNRGPTKTHALLPGSPAINAGDPTLVLGANGVPEFDQRGAPFTRIAGGRIDIGAYESQHAAGTFDGDFDGDGDVDGRDFLAWQRGYPVSGPQVTKLHGDATGDNDVDANDLAVWQATYGSELSAVGSRLSAIQEMNVESQEPQLGLPLWSLDSRPFNLASRTNDLVLDGETIEVDSVDRAFDNWMSPRRSRFDFGDIATRRSVERESVTAKFEKVSE